MQWTKMTEEQIEATMNKEACRQQKNKRDAKAAKASKPVAKHGKKKSTYIGDNRRSKSTNALKAHNAEE